MRRVRTYFALFPDLFVVHNWHYTAVAKVQIYTSLTTHGHIYLALFFPYLVALLIASNFLNNTFPAADFEIT